MVALEMLWDSWAYKATKILEAVVLCKTPTRKPNQPDKWIGKTFITYQAIALLSTVIMPLFYNSYLKDLGATWHPCRCFGHFLVVPSFLRTPIRSWTYFSSTNTKFPGCIVLAQYVVCTSQCAHTPTIVVEAGWVSTICKVLPLDHYSANICQVTYSFVQHGLL